MRAFYHDNIPGNQTALHDSGRSVTVDDLKANGLLYWRIPVEDNGKWEQEIDEVARERSYKNRDVKETSREILGAEFDAMLKMVYAEHIHEDEEIRFVLAGTGFFDIREHATDSWIRIHVGKGDLLVVPAGIYHRFSLDEKEYMKVLRLFKEEPKWTAHYRGNETDANPHRLDYLKSVQAVVPLTA
ncbi:1,2-dihydroxy-3-keto-5-methylthiopentene dioxygenase [Steccherinum ochraceum]|uniref:Acireductone dioxygenase n=1 Tax=Steccherinum ochraceum TaxID=92696 RepID=A0A4R0RKU1_9APHY|nr:1,2-dihydroxy-3-keto-5-methylthiopentene dioxygenase [Steccherinum ochraceum]